MFRQEHISTIFSLWVLVFAIFLLSSPGVVTEFFVEQDRVDEIVRKSRSMGSKWLIVDCSLAIYDIGVNPLAISQMDAEFHYSWMPSDNLEAEKLPCCLRTNEIASL